MTRLPFSPEENFVLSPEGWKDTTLKLSILAYNAISEALSALNQKIGHGARLTRHEALILLITGLALAFATNAPIQAFEPEKAPAEPAPVSEIMPTSEVIHDTPTALTDNPVSPDEELAQQLETGEVWLAEENSPTATPEATSAPEILKPTQSIDELIPEGSPLREDFYRLMKSQFDNGGLQLENGQYTLYCIATEDMHRHEPFIELPEGNVVTHSIPCQYFDAEGNEQLVYIPAVRFKANEKLTQFLGFTAAPNSPTYEEAWEIMTTGLARDIGPINLLNNHGYTGAGHPFTLHFGTAEAEEIQAFASEIQEDVQANPELFAASGDPVDLYKQLLFPAKQVGFRNNFVQHVN